MTLLHLRSQIDLLDQELLGLLAKRVALARETRALKTNARDAKREDDLRTQWRKGAEALGLDAKKTEAVLDAVIDLSHSAQQP